MHTYVHGHARRRRARPTKRRRTRVAIFATLLRTLTTRETIYRINGRRCPEVLFCDDFASRCRGGYNTALFAFPSDVARIFAVAQRDGYIHTGHIYWKTSARQRTKRCCRKRIQRARHGENILFVGFNLKIDLADARATRVWKRPKLACRSVFPLYLVNRIFLNMLHARTFISSCAICYR